MMSCNSGFFDVIKENLKNGIEVSFLPTGDSMLPLIRGNRDRVFLSNVDDEKFLVGDIVLFSYNDTAILHRIVEIKNDDEVILKGDGNLTAECCLASDIIAKVKFIKRGKYCIYKDSIFWKTYRFLWPENKFFRRFFLFLYKILTKNNAQNENFK